MNKTKIIETIAFTLVIAFGLVGAIVLSIVFHEYSHASDFKEIAKETQICGLVLPTKASDLVNSEGGYYIFSYENDNITSSKVDGIQEYTEYKAYSVTFSVLLLFTICLIVIFRKFLIEFINVKRSKYELPIITEDKNRRTFLISSKN